MLPTSMLTDHSESLTVAQICQVSLCYSSNTCVISSFSRSFPHCAHAKLTLSMYSAENSSLDPPSSQLCSCSAISNSRASPVWNKYKYLPRFCTQSTHSFSEWQWTMPFAFFCVCDCRCISDFAPLHYCKWCGLAFSLVYVLLNAHSWWSVVIQYSHFNLFLSWRYHDGTVSIHGMPQWGYLACLYCHSSAAVHGDFNKYSEIWEKFNKKPQRSRRKLFKHVSSIKQSKCWIVKLYLQDSWQEPRDLLSICV